MRRPSLREQIPHLDAAQLRALQRIARSGGRLPLRVVPRDLAGSLMDAHAVRADRVTRDLRLTHLGLLALLQSRHATQIPTLAEARELTGRGFLAVTLERNR